MRRPRVASSAGGYATRRHRARRGRLLLRYGGRLLRRARRRDPRSRDRGAAQPRADLDEGDLPHRRRAERRRIVAPLSRARRRGEPCAARDRSHRSLPAARVRRADADRGGAAHARRSGARRKDSLHRLLELQRLAPHEVAGDLRPTRVGALRRAPGVLLARRTRLRVGADAARDRSEGVGAGVEPARVGALDRKDPARSAAARDQPHARAGHQGGRAARR
jgi:hypothetical protein